MRVNKAFICKKVLDNYILIDTKHNNKSVYKLNETSKYIYDLILSNYTLEDIINDVKVKYDIDLVKASEDVTEFIDELYRLGIVND